MISRTITAAAGSLLDRGQSIRRATLPHVNCPLAMCWNNWSAKWRGEGGGGGGRGGSSWLCAGITGQLNGGGGGEGGSSWLCAGITGQLNGGGRGVVAGYVLE